jgi:hypothetical protein
MKRRASDHFNVKFVKEFVHQHAEPRHLIDAASDEELCNGCMLLWCGTKAVDSYLTLMYSLTHLPLSISSPFTLTLLQPAVYQRTAEVDVGRRIGLW